jgi:hypothetical protein
LENKRWFSFLQSLTGKCNAAEMISVGLGRNRLAQNAKAVPIAGPA